jgi:hypothetical protein
MPKLVVHRFVPFVVVALAATAFAVGTAARATAPSYFPSGFNMSETAYTLRFAGADRFATAGTAALLAAINQDKTSGYPFDEGDPGSAATAYGAGACPGTVLVAASDGLPDALAASALRSIASLTLTSGGHTFDTSNAVLLLTDTARPPDNATNLSQETKTVLSSIKAACTSFDAIILGGTSAVPANVEGDLMTAGAGTVGRIAGIDRYDTAGQIAQHIAAALGLPAVKYYSSATDAGTSEPSTVFLAEGTTGADALAVGPVAADLNAPILLTATEGLPATTAQALAALKPSHIIVLGGTAAIPDSVANTAIAAAGTTNKPIRISGPNRYATSVQIAENLDDIWPANATNSMGGANAAFSNQGFALARSEGTGDNHVGWPDALSSALVLSSLHHSSTVPKRLAPPIEANDGTIIIGGKPSPARFPLLLTTGTALAPDVDSFLKGLYPAATKTAPNPSPPASQSADDGGFAYVFGGTSAIAQSVELAAAQDLSGGAYKTALQSDVNPKATDTLVFYTAADLTGYTQSAAGNGGMFAATPSNNIVVGPGDKICAFRNALVGVQFFDTFAPGGLAELPTTVPYELSGPFPGGQSVPFCVSASGDVAKTATLLGISLSGNITNFMTRSWSSPSSLMTTTGTGSQSTPDTGSAKDGSNQVSIDAPPPPGGTATLDASYGNISGITVTFRSTAFTRIALTIHIARTLNTNSPDGSDDPITCTGTVTGLNSSGGTAFLGNYVAESSTSPTGGTPLGSGNAIKCVGAYTIGSATGMIHYTITGDGATAALSDLVLDGNA